MMTTCGFQSMPSPGWCHKRMMNDSTTNLGRDKEKLFVDGSDARGRVEYLSQSLAQVLNIWRYRATTYWDSYYCLCFIDAGITISPLYSEGEYRHYDTCIASVRIRGHLSCLAWDFDHGH